MRNISIVAEFPACVIADLVFICWHCNYSIVTVSVLFITLKIGRVALDGESAFSVLFLINFTFLNQLAIDFIYILLEFLAT